MTSVAAVVVSALAAAVAGGAAAFHPSAALIALAALAAVVCAVAMYVHFTRDATNDDADRPVTIVVLAVGAALLVAAVVLAGLSFPKDDEFPVLSDGEYENEGSHPVQENTQPYDNYDEINLDPDAPDAPYTGRPLSVYDFKKNKDRYNSVMAALDPLMQEFLNE
jgi:hypothetical protein